MGKLVILSGPSGAGKSTIVKQLQEKPEYNLRYSVSATTRKKREGEEHGEHYYFLSIDDFKEKIEEDRFIEWEEVYKNHYYGTLKTEVERIMSSGNNLIFDIDVMGAINIKRHYKDDCITIFIAPPSLEVLEERLKARNTETPETLRKRLGKAKMELHYSKKFHHIVTNQDLDTAIAEVNQLVTGFLGL